MTAGEPGPGRCVQVIKPCLSPISMEETNPKFKVDVCTSIRHLCEIFTSVSAFMQLFLFACGFLTVAPPTALSVLWSLCRGPAFTVTSLFRPRPYPQALNSPCVTSLSRDLIFVSAQNGALQPFGDPIAGKRAQSPLGSRGRGASHCACGCGRGEARRAQPSVTSCIPFPTVGLAPVPDPPAPRSRGPRRSQLCQPCARPVRSAGPSSGGRLKSGCTSFFFGDLTPLLRRVSLCSSRLGQGDWGYGRC